MSTTITSASISPLPVAAAVAPQQSTPAPNPAELVFQSALGYIVSACLNVAVKMRIPDLIGEGVYELGALA